MNYEQFEQDIYSSLNLTPHEVNEFTYTELSLMLKGNADRQQKDFEQQLKLGQWTAWHIAAYVGMSFGGEKLPDLNEILTKPIFDTKPIDEPVALSKEELFNQSKRWTIAMIKKGIPVSQAVKDKYGID